MILVFVAYVEIYVVFLLLLCSRSASMFRLSLTHSNMMPSLISPGCFLALYAKTLHERAAVFVFVASQFLCVQPGDLDVSMPEVIRHVSKWRAAPEHTDRKGMTQGMHFARGHVGSHDV